MMISQNVPFHVEWGGKKGNAVVPECAMLISCPAIAVKKNLLITCQRISRQQPITDLSLHMLNFKGLDESDMFHMSRNAKSVTLEHCSIPSRALNHLMKQVAECNTIHKIQVVATSLRGISSFSLTNNTTLKYLHLGSTNMSVGQRRQVCHQLNDLPCLEHINISDNILTGCLPSFLPDAHPGLPSLQELQLRDTGLIYEDLQHLFTIIQRDKLPKLRVLDLSYNTLAGCLSSFIPDPHLDLPEQEKLNLEDAPHHLSNILSESSLLPKNYSGLSALEELHLSNTELEELDVQRLCDLVESCNLPELHDLDLSNNRSNRNEEELDKLREVCLFHYQGELILDLQGHMFKSPVNRIDKMKNVGTPLPEPPWSSSSSVSEPEDKPKEELPPLEEEITKEKPSESSSSESETEPEPEEREYPHNMWGDLINRANQLDMPPPKTLSTSSSESEDEPKEEVPPLEEEIRKEKPSESSSSESETELEPQEKLKEVIPPLVVEITKEKLSDSSSSSSSLEEREYPFNMWDDLINKANQLDMPPPKTLSTSSSESEDKPKEEVPPLEEEITKEKPSESSSSESETESEPGDEPRKDEPPPVAEITKGKLSDSSSSSSSSSSLLEKEEE